MAQPAIKTIDGNEAAVTQDAPIPELEDDFVLAETKALALNPADWAHMRFLSKPGSTLGCDWAGVVLMVGKAVTKFRLGDEVFGVCHGGDNYKSDAGAFARVVVSKESATFHKPAKLSFEEASTLGVGLITVGQVMYEVGGLPNPSKDYLSQKSTKDILIYGGSSATGSLAIQFAKLSGCRVLTTASPSNFPMLLARGADHVFDYNDPTSITSIRSIANDSLTYIVDCIGKASTAEFCAQVLSPRSGHYHSVAFPGPSNFKELRPEASVKVTSTTAYLMLGEAFEFKDGTRFEADKKEAEFGKEWHEIIEALLKQDILIPHPANVRDGGLEGVLEGIRELENTGGLSGKKIVYSMAW